MKPISLLTAHKLLGARGFVHLSYGTGQFGRGATVSDDVPPPFSV